MDLAELGHGEAGLEKGEASLLHSCESPTQCGAPVESLQFLFCCQVSILHFLTNGAAGWVSHVELFKNLNGFFHPRLNPMIACHV